MYTDSHVEQHIPNAHQITSSVLGLQFANIPLEKFEQHKLPAFSKEYDDAFPSWTWSIFADWFYLAAQKLTFWSRHKD